MKVDMDDASVTVVWESDKQRTDKLIAAVESKGFGSGLKSAVSAKSGEFRVELSAANIKAGESIEVTIEVKGKETNAAVEAPDGFEASSDAVTVGGKEKSATVTVKAGDDAKAGAQVLKVKVGDSVVPIDFYIN